MVQSNRIHCNAIAGSILCHKIAVNKHIKTHTLKVYLRPPNYNNMNTIIIKDII